MKHKGGMKGARGAMDVGLLFVLVWIFLFCIELFSSSKTIL